MTELRYKAGDLVTVLVDGPTSERDQYASRGWHKKGDIVRVYRDTSMDCEQVTTIDDNAPSSAYGHTEGNKGWKIHYTQLAPASGYTTEDLLEYLDVLEDFRTIDRGLAVAATKRQWCPEYEKEIDRINGKLSTPRFTGKRADIKEKTVRLRHFVVDGEDNLATDLNQSYGVLLLEEVS